MNRLTGMFRDDARSLWETWVGHRPGAPRAPAESRFGRGPTPEGIRRLAFEASRAGQPVVGLLSAGVEKLPLTKDQDPVMARIAGEAPARRRHGRELIQTVDRSQPGSQMAGPVLDGWQTGKECEQSVRGKGISTGGSLRVFVN